MMLVYVWEGMLVIFPAVLLGKIQAHPAKHHPGYCFLVRTPLGCSYPNFILKHSISQYNCFGCCLYKKNLYQDSKNNNCDKTMCMQIVHVTV